MSIKKCRQQILLVLTVIVLVFAFSGCSQSEIETTTSTTPVTAETTAPQEQTTTATEISTVQTTQVLTETTTEQEPSLSAPPEEDTNLVTFEEKDYWLIRSYNTIASAKYDEDNFLERFSDLYRNVAITPGKTVIGSSTVYHDGTIVYITAQDGSWSYGPATLRTHHTAEGASNLQLYFGSAEECEAFEALNLSGCTVYEVAPVVIEAEPISVDGNELYLTHAGYGSLYPLSYDSVDTDEKYAEAEDLTIYADPKLIPVGSTVYLRAPEFKEGYSLPHELDGKLLGPFTNIVSEEAAGGRINILFHSSEQFDEINEYAESDRKFEVLILNDSPISSEGYEREPITTEAFMTNTTTLPDEESLSEPEYVIEIHQLVNDSDADKKYGYGHPAISDLVFSYSFDDYSKEIKDHLFNYFSKNALTPLKNKQDDFSPKYVVDFNNGWFVALDPDTHYCEAATLMSYDTDKYNNHIVDESFADALTERGKPYALSAEAQKYFISLMSETEVGEYPPYPEENYYLPKANNLAVELDESWADVKTVKICYPTWSSFIEEDYPIKRQFFVSYTIDDPEVVTQLIYCLHPDNMKPDVDTYRTSPNAYICFDNGYIARMYFLSHEPVVSNSCFINGTPSSMTKEAEEYISALMLNIEFAQ